MRKARDSRRSGTGGGSDRAQFAPGTVSGGPPISSRASERAMSGAFGVGMSLPVVLGRERVGACAFVGVGPVRQMDALCRHLRKDGAGRTERAPQGLDLSARRIAVTA